MLCLSGFELYSRWVPLNVDAALNVSPCFAGKHYITIRGTQKKDKKTR